MSWTLSLGEAHSLPQRDPATVKRPAPPANGTRNLVDPVTGVSVDAQLYARETLQPGAPVTGPAIIAEAETSSLIPAGFTAMLSIGGHLVIERNAP